MSVVEEITPPIQPTATDPHAVVCDLYDVFREARMNVKYYGKLLASYQRLNLGIEIAIALGTSGTLIALFSSQAGKALVLVLGAIAAILGVLKPILNIPKRIERVSKLWSGYQGAFNRPTHGAKGTDSKEGGRRHRKQHPRTA